MKIQPTPPLLQSLRIQRRVVSALVMREVLTRFGRHNIGFLWLFVEPMLFTVGVAALWTATQSVHGSNLPIVAFAVSGYSSVLLWRNMPSRCAAAITPNLALMYHRNVRVIDVFLSRIALEIAGTTASLIALATLFTAIGWMEPPHDVALILIGWGMLAWFGASLAILIGSLSERFEAVEKLWHPAAYLLFPLSGAAFIVEALPPRAQELILYLPMVHGVEVLREGFFGNDFHPHYDLSYMTGWCLALSLSGLALTRQISRTIAPNE